jgi:hypothetical protein
MRPPITKSSNASGAREPIPIISDERGMDNELYRVVPNIALHWVERAAHPHVLRE